MLSSIKATLPIPTAVELPMEFDQAKMRGFYCPGIRIPKSWDISARGSNWHPADSEWDMDFALLFGLPLFRSFGTEAGTFLRMAITGR